VPAGRRHPRHGDRDGRAGGGRGAYREQVSEAVGSDEEKAAYVAELEQRADVLEDEENLPSIDSLAAELTRFFREREAGNGDLKSGPSEQP
jgi:hypothetical protein